MPTVLSCQKQLALAQPLAVTSMNFSQLVVSHQLPCRDKPTLEGTKSPGRGKSGKLGRQRLHDFKRGANFGFTVIDHAGLADAERVAHGSDAELSSQPKLILKFLRRHPFDSVHHDRSGKLRVHRRTDPGGGDLLQAV